MTSEFVTTGDIAARLKDDRDRVSYAIRKLAIKPIGRAGPTRIFPVTVTSEVKKFLSKKQKVG